MRRVEIPPHVRMSEAEHGGGVILDVRTGRWYALNATARSLWAELCRTGDVDTAVDRLSGHYPAALQARARADAAALVDALAAKRLVAFTGDGQQGPRVTEPVRSSRDSAVTARSRPVRASRGRAHAALLLALVLLRLPFRWTVSLVGLVRLSRCRAAPMVDEASALLLAIDRAARWYPVRVACLERSLAAVLAAGMYRLRLDLALGVADDPYTFHAWVEIDETPVAETPEPDFAKYRRVLRL